MYKNEMIKGNVAPWYSSRLEWFHVFDNEFDLFSAENCLEAIFISIFII